MPRVDYDVIADSYDRDEYRRKDFDPELQRFIDDRGSAEGLRIIDIGCGTGQQLEANRAGLSGAVMVGADRYAGMLRHAKNRGHGVGFVQVDGPFLPFATDTFDYASNQYSYHHVGRTPAFVAEVFRVLRPGGRFAIFNMDPWAMDGWACYRYFPATRYVDERDFTPRPELERLFADAGFVDVAHDYKDHSSTRTVRDMHDWAALRNTTSQLLAISDEDYEAGMSRLRDELAADPDAPVDNPSMRLCLRGTKP